jgi:hypothetical protein
MRRIPKGMPEFVEGSAQQFIVLQGNPSPERILCLAHEVNRCPDDFGLNAFSANHRPALFTLDPTVRQGVTGTPGRAFSPRDKENFQPGLLGRNLPKVNPQIRGRPSIQSLAQDSQLPGIGVGRKRNRDRLLSRPTTQKEQQPSFPGHQVRSRVEEP